MAECTRRVLGLILGASRRALRTQRALSWPRGREVCFSSAAAGDYTSEIGSSRRALRTQRALSWARGREVCFSSAAGNYTSEVDEINSKFAEAREEIEMAMESKETVYFDEEAHTAREAVQLVLNKYQTLLDKLPDPDKSSIQRSMGLKMEQLKAELAQLSA